ncbi:hypothetical protein [Trichlorobacter ammonificans]|uniref:DNA helicase PriA n=1 Tax=Trichlorobacter ammonificans TaxID=2916410 RepID=A0ABM9D7A1_9BACT|nr:hypothetical protein [Trichlorobacter ammonificans]CAH2031055.1 conserved protein of unknown function [Trichlorobacter ammonificans]
MRCTFCGHEFDESEGTRPGCGACGGGGCRGIHCPRCGYKNIPEPELLKRLKRLVSKSDKGA